MSAISHAKSVTLTAFTGAITVLNSAGVSTTMNATDNIQVNDWMSAHNQLLTISGNTLGNSSALATNIVMAAGNNVTLSLATAGSNATLSFIAGGGNQLSIGGNTTGTAALISSGTALLAGGNNITLSQNGNSITFIGPSTGTAAQTNQTLGLFGVGNTTGAGSSTTADARSLSFQGSGIVSVGMSNGSVLISAPAAATLAPMSAGMSTGGNSLGVTGLASQQLILAGGNNISLSGSTNLGSMTISIIGGAGGGGGGVAIAGSNATLTSGTVGLLAGGGAITIGSQTGNNLTFSVPATSSLSVTGFLSVSTNGSTISLGAGPLSFFGLGNTTQGSSGTIDGRSVSFNALGNASVGISNGSIIISGGTAAAGNAIGGISAGTVLQTSGTVSFANSNGVTFGLSAGTLTASAAGGGGGVNMAVTNTTFTSGTVAFSALGGALTLGSAAQQINFSVPATSSLVGVNGISLSTNGSTISISGQGVLWSAGASSVSATSMVASNSNGITFGLSTVAGAATLTASYNSTQFAGTGTSVTGNAAITLNSNGLALNASSLAGTATAITGSLSITLNSAGLSINASNLVGANTAKTGNIAMTANSGGISINATSLAGTGTSIASTTGNFSMVLNTTGLTLSVPYRTRFIYPSDQEQTYLTAPGNASLTLQYVPTDCPITATRLDALMSWIAASSATNATMAIALSAYAAIFTRNGSTLSSLSSGSTQTTYSYASNSAGQTQLLTGAIRPMSVPVNINMAPGEYFIGFNMVTLASSVGLTTTSLGQTISMMGGPDLQSALPYAEFTNQTATSVNLFNGMGVYSAATTGIPAAISLSAINMTGSAQSAANICIVMRNA